WQTSKQSGSCFSKKYSPSAPHAPMQSPVLQLRRQKRKDCTLGSEAFCFAVVQSFCSRHCAHAPAHSGSAICERPPQPGNLHSEAQCEATQASIAPACWSCVSGERGCVRTHCERHAASS